MTHGLRVLSLFPVLPATGAYFALKGLWDSYISVLSDLRLKPETTEEKGHRKPRLFEILFKFDVPGLILDNIIAPGKTEREETLRQYFIISASLAGGLLGYGIVGFFMAQGKVADLEASKLVQAAGIALGMTCIGAGLGMGIIGREAIRRIYFNPSSATFYLILMALSEGVALYGLVVMFLIIRVGEGLSLTGINALYGTSLFFGVLALLGGFLVGYLPARIGEVIDGENATKKLIAAVVEESPLIRGLVYVFTKLGKM